MIPIFETREPIENFKALEKKAQGKALTITDDTRVNSNVPLEIKRIPTRTKTPAKTTTTGKNNAQTNPKNVCLYLI